MQTLLPHENVDGKIFTSVDILASTRYEMNCVFHLIMSSLEDRILVPPTLRKPSRFWQLIMIVLNTLRWRELRYYLSLLILVRGNAWSRNQHCKISILRLWSNQHPSLVGIIGHSLQVLGSCKFCMKVNMWVPFTVVQQGPNILGLSGIRPLNLELLGTTKHSFTTMEFTRPSSTTSPSNLSSTIATLIDDCQRATGGMRVDPVDIITTQAKDLTTINTPLAYTVITFCRSVFLFLLKIFSVQLMKYSKICLTLKPIVWGSKRQHHDENLLQLLLHMKDKNVTINSKKSTFAKEELLFLGFRVNTQGYAPDPDRLRPITQAPLPLSKELWSLMGCL